MQPSQENVKRKLQGRRKHVGTPAKYAQATEASGAPQYRQNNPLKHRQPRWHLGMTVVQGPSCHRLAQFLTFPSLCLLAGGESDSSSLTGVSTPKFNIQSGLAQSPEYKNSSINHQKTKEEKAACYKLALMEQGTEAVCGEWLSWRQQMPAGGVQDRTPSGQHSPEA